MLVYMIVLADHCIQARYEEAIGYWEVHVTDTHAGKSGRCHMTGEEWCACLALANSAGEDKLPGYWVERLYTVAEHAMAKFEYKELRFIP